MAHRRAIKRGMGYLKGNKAKVIWPDADYLIFSCSNINTTFSNSYNIIDKSLLLEPYLSCMFYLLSLKSHCDDFIKIKYLLQFITILISNWSTNKISLWYQIRVRDRYMIKKRHLKFDSVWFYVPTSYSL